jgi:alpha-amylase
MRRLRLILVLALCVCSTASFARTYHVLLQGFHYNSSGVETGWYNILQENAQRIKDSGFTLVWFPPPSRSVTPLGYEPNELNNLNSAYGSEEQLRAAINALAPEVKVLADIVINHRSGTQDACTFTNPDWPEHTIVKDDESCRILLHPNQRNPLPTLG